MDWTSCTDSTLHPAPKVARIGPGGVPGIWPSETVPAHSTTPSLTQEPAGPSPFRSVISVAQRTVSALFGWQPADQGDQCLVSRGVDRPVDHLRRGRGGFARAPRPRRPIMGGADGPTLEAAATVRAHVGQDRVNALAAERAFICAVHRVDRGGRERAVAVLAGGPELEHVAFWHRAPAPRRPRRRR
jgi:hypothetical protein